MRQVIKYNDHAPTAERPAKISTHLNQHIVSYLADIAAGLDDGSLDDADPSLVDAVFAELQGSIKAHNNQHDQHPTTGKERNAAMDATACRVLERLLPAAAAAAHRPTLLAALTADADALFGVATSPYGSHLLEALLTRDTDVAAVVELVATHIADLVDHKYGSFVARHMLRLLLEETSPAKHTAKQGLAALLAPPPPTPAVVHPTLLQRLIDAVVADETLADWPCHQFASPFLQALLAATGAADWCRIVAASLGGTSDDGALKKKKKTSSSSVKWMTSLANIQPTMRDRVGSHFVEAVFLSAPSPKHHTALYLSTIQPSLPELSTHPHANFAVQAALRHVHGEALTDAISQLAPCVGDLLTTQRGGVVVALTSVAAAHPDQHGAAVCAMLAGPGKRVAGAHAPLLFLLYQDAAPSEHAPLSTIGCALLHLVFSSFTQAQCQVFGNALATLPSARLTALATSPSGVRVLEAFVLGPASKKQRRGVLTALQHAWGDVASRGIAGCVFVEKCAAVVDAAGREAIVQGLASSIAQLRRSSAGTALLTTLHVEAFMRDADAWRRRQASGDKVSAQFLQDVLCVDSQPPRKRHKKEGGDAFVDMLSVGL